MDTKVTHPAAELQHLGLLSCTGDDARTFLQAQLTNGIEDIADGEARRAGWCSAKGRLLALFLVVPQQGGFLLQVSRDIAPAIAKRLSMFVLRAKVKVADVSDAWTQYGLWGEAAEAHLAQLGLTVPQGELKATHAQGIAVVRVGAQRFLVLAPAAQRGRLSSLALEQGEVSWALQEIRSGLPQVVLATQEEFVPQMVNLERLGAVDFKKGCYPGQEIVARTQYRGALKRRMARARVSSPAVAGDDLYADEFAGQASGKVVAAAAVPGGGSELLAVVQISALEGGQPIRLRAPDGPHLELLPLPYA
ncbi:MAG TPA: folate-binding protein [Burkholderiales bacterium]|nr:folate-binding protein [Burkholderiales bacterium]